MQRPCLIVDDEEILETRNIDRVKQANRKWNPTVLENKKPFDSFYVNTHHKKDQKTEFPSRAINVAIRSKSDLSLSEIVRGILDNKSSVSKEVIPPQTDGVVQDTRG